MAILPIRMAGDQVLRQKARKISTIDASIQKLIDDMIETMRDAPGVGLAANQVGVALRVIVIEVPGRVEAGKPRPADGVVLLNDVLDSLGPTQETAADVIDLIKLLHNAGALKARLIVR